MRVKIVIRPKILAAVGIFLSQLCALPCIAQVNFKISPPVTEINLSRGGTKVFSFELINENRERSLSFTIAPVDVGMARDGTTEFRDPATTPYSCSTWISIEPKTVVVEPGQTKKIIGKISIPAQAIAGGYYSAVACELNAADAPHQAGGKIRWRIASLVKVTVTGGRIERNARIDDFFLRTLFEDGESVPKGLPFMASVHNLGNIHIAATGKLVVMTPDRRRKGEVDFNVGTGTVLPGHTREFLALYDRVLPAGEYIARATFRYGGMGTLETEMPFMVTSAKSQVVQPEHAAISVAAIEAVPASLNLKIPRGGFRTAGFAVRNQSAAEVRITAAFDQSNPIKEWFSLTPGQIRIPSGAESKISLTATVPPDAPAGTLQISIIMVPAGVSGNGAAESLDPVQVGINIEIPKT